MRFLVLFLLAAAEGDRERLVRAVAESGQVLEIAASPSERLAPLARIAPGAPPALAFRMYEGKERHRFSNTELMLDDAGH